MLNPLNTDLQAKLANYQNIPLELRQLKQWVNWHYEDIGALKPTKVPHGSVQNSATWISFDEAVSVVAHCKADGIGFVFSDNDPYAGIDLDECKDDWLALERQQKIFKEFDSYSEKSVGGQGLHIIIKGKIPIGRKRSKIEVYSQLRYFTFTGNVYNAKPIEERQELLNLLWEQMGASIPQTMLFTGDKDEKETDTQIIEKAKSSKNADKFNGLLEGRWRDFGYSSQSEADYAFIDIIAFYSRNKKQIARIFRASPLGQREKARRDDYVEYMIHNSFDNMLPQIDIEGLSIEIEKLRGGVAQSVELSAHNTLVTGSNPVILTNPAVSSNGKTAAFDAVNEGSIPSTASKLIQLPPGLLGEIAQFIYAASPRPVPEIALAGAIGLMSGICGRAYNVSSTGLNQYVLLLAKTGRGKEAMASGIGKLINIVRQQVPTVTEFIGPDEIASGPALYKYLAEQQSFVSVLSEFGLRLMQMADADGSSPAVSLRRMFLQLYAKSGFSDVANPSIYSDKDRNVAAIQSPAFSILGESTPERFYQNLNEDMISEGLLPRFLLIEYDGPRTSENKNHANAQPSFSLIEKLVTIAANAKTVMGASPRRAINISLDAQAQTISDAYSRQCDKIINDEKSNQVVIQLWNRAHLKVLKLAGCVAIGINMYDPIITAEHINWAIDMVSNDINTLTKRFEEGDVGSNTGEIKQIELVIKMTKEYIFSDFEKIQKYVGNDERSRQLHQHKIMPYIFLSRKLLSYAQFKNDKRGATDALKRCLQVLCDRDSFREISKHEMTQRFGSTQKAFAISDVNVLK